MEASFIAIGHRPPLESREQSAAFVGENWRVLVDVVSCHWWQLMKLCRRYIDTVVAGNRIAKYLCDYYNFLDLNQVTFVHPGFMKANHLETFIQQSSNDYTNSTQSFTQLTKVRKWDKLICRLTDIEKARHEERVRISDRIEHTQLKMQSISRLFWLPGIWNNMFANLDNDLTFNFITVPGSAHVEIARLCRFDNSTIAFSKDMNLFVM